MSTYTSVRLDSVFEAVKFPAGVSDLDSGLTNVDWDAFALLEKRKFGLKVGFDEMRRLLKVVNLDTNTSGFFRFLFWTGFDSLKLVRVVKTVEYNGDNETQWDIPDPVENFFENHKFWEIEFWFSLFLFSSDSDCIVLNNEKQLVWSIKCIWTQFWIRSNIILSEKPKNVRSHPEYNFQVNFFKLKAF